jgi:hypothetical protein
MTQSARIARATDTGTGFDRPPSTSQTPSRHTGVKMPGIAIDARTASMTGPSCSQISRPVSSSAATAANGSGSALISRPSEPTGEHLDHLLAPQQAARHPHVQQAHHCLPRKRRDPVFEPIEIAVGVHAPTSAPIDVPQTTSGRIPASSNARTAPMCAQPRAAPPPRTRAIRGRRFGRFIVSAPSAENPGRRGAKEVSAHHFICANQDRWQRSVA